MNNNTVCGTHLIFFIIHVFHVISYREQIYLQFELPIFGVVVTDMDVIAVRILNNWQKSKLISQ
jgi:hypothetical protein